MNYSVAIFGSSLRDDFDKYSDKDLLIVADNYDLLKQLEEKYSSENWSISFYTYSKLEYLSKNGSLFLKHLKEEAKILHDDNNAIKNILSDYSIKSSYNLEVKEASDFFEIIQYIPHTNSGLAWFCDTLYVGLRNYLIFSNSEENVFEFSFNKLLIKLKNENRISQNQLNILKELRVIKRNYREDIIDEFPSTDFVNKVIEIIEYLGLIKKIQIIKPTSFQSLVEEKINSYQYSPYQKLRLLEGYYTSQNQNLFEIKKIISNPQFYAMKFKDEIYISKLISTIKNATQQRLIANNGYFGKSVILVTR
jgi:hypothetical protein